MNETQRRIKAYKAALPGLRERVIAVALLLAMSVAMMTSATFAWITISRAPELSGVSTTVAANGNLEIALAQGDGRTPPGESQVGDSAAAENQTITGANITWGNLVNLSDPVYGLDQISLRPALLSDYNLNRYPLYGASYGNDGRVVATTDRYEFASWATADDGTKYFAAGNKATHGVRAIASVTYQNITGNAVFTSLWNKAEAEFGNARTGYINLLTDQVDIYDHTGAASKSTKVLGGLLSIYAQDLVNTYLNDNATNSNCSQYIVPLYNMMLSFRDILLAEGKALMYLANLQAYMNDPNVGTATYKDEEVEKFLAETDAALKNKGITLVSFTDPDEGLRNDWSVLNAQIAAIEKLMRDKGFYNENGTYKTSLPTVVWDDFDTILNKIVDIVSTEMDGTEIGKVNSSNVGNFASAVLGGDPDVLIKKGIIRNLEQRTGVRMADEETMGKKIQVTVKVKVLVTMTPTATVTTNAAPDYYSIIDKMKTEEMNTTTQGGDAVGEDTFGMAVDLWVRTNTPDVVLTLEGSTTYTDEPATGKDKNGNTTNLYVLKVDGVESDIYKLTENDVTTWYYASNHEQVDSALMTDFNEATSQKMNKIVSGYEGENRIWENWEDMLKAGLIMEDNTTQGAGSCFVFYGDPSEQSRILDLLNSFTVAFVDVDGNRLGTAMLATERAFAVNGKVTVPLEMVNGTAYEDEKGEEKYGILPLTRNEATRISAVVYLNGMRLENKNVLAEGEIEGNLNLQFGSSISLNNPDNEKLQTEYRTVTAMANAVTTPAAGSPATSNSVNAPIQYNFDGTAKQVRVDLTVDGEQPEKISGFFVRAINQTQGSRGETVSFNPNNDGTWSAAFNLTTPGKYVLRSVIVDGAEYVLDATPSVEISGYTISRVTINREAGMHMTADGSFAVEVTATIDTDPALRPSQVRAQFRSEDGREYNALMSYDSSNGKWVGTANINSSGTYTLVYLVIDGEYRDVPEQFQKTLIVYLGMTTRIYSDHATSFAYTGTAVTIPVQSKIWDDSEAEVRGLTGVKLYYHVSGSALDQNGMQAELSWIEETEYYEGNMLLKTPGIYSFNRLQINTVTGSTGNISISTIRKALAAPSFTAVSLDPPTFYAEVENNYQLAPKNDAALKIQMADASSAQVWAKVVKSGPIAGAQATYVVAGQIGEQEGQNINPFSFTLPAAESTGQDGEWVITDLYLQNVYVPNENAAEGEPAGKMYESTVAEGTLPTLEQLTTTEADKFYHIDVSDKGGADGIYTYVVSNVKTVVTKNGEAYSGEAFGGTKANPTGTFMQSHEVTGVTFTIMDWNNEPVRNVTAVKWNIHYNDATDVAYGGYDGATLSDNPVPLTKDANDASKFTAPTQTLYLAGEYTTSLAVTIGNGTLTFSNAMPSYTVASVKPSVTVGTVSPSGSINTTIKWKSGIGGRLSYTLGTKQTNGVNQATNTATAYAQATTKNMSTDATFNLPKLTFVVAGVDASSTVKFTIPAGSATAISFSKVGNGESGAITLGVINPNIHTSKGGLTGTTYAVDGYLGHGDNVEIKNISISRGGVEYTVTLDNPIYIKNPSSTPTS